MKKSKEEFTNLLIRNIPKEREEVIRGILETLSKSYNEEWVIDQAPISMENMLRLLTVLEVKMKQVEKALNNLRAIGFNINIEQLENRLRLREQFIDRVISKLDKKIDVIYNSILKPKYEPPKKKLTIKKPKRTVIEFAGVKGIITPRLLKILSANKDREFTSKQLAERVYNKSTKVTRDNVTSKLKKHRRLIKATKKGKFLYFRWNPKARRVL